MSLTAIRDWKSEVDALRYSASEGDRVLIKAPVDSFAAPYNEQTGTIHTFQEQWILVKMDEGDLQRFRPDELMQL